MTPVVNVNPVRASRYYYSRPIRFVSATPTHREITLLESTPLDLLLNDLEPGYEALQSIPIQVQRLDDAFVASFNAANIHTSGETVIAAARNLRSLILDIFDSLVAEDTASLGPAPQHQLVILLRYVKKDDPQ